MDRGCRRQPRSRFRLITLMTIMGLALTALLPIVRSAPGLSRTPRRVSAPVVLAYVPADPTESDSDPSDSSTVPPDRQEEGPCDFEELAEETSSIEWLAVRLSRGSEADWAQKSSSVDSQVESPAVRPTRRNSLIVGLSRSGLSIRLCRLLF